MKKNCVYIFLLSSFYSYAENCTDIISFSKLTKTVVEDKSIFEQNANNFCKEYSKNKGSTDASSYGLSYKFLAASMDNSNASVEAIATKFCSASSSGKSSASAYRRYIEEISPNAYSAYEQCLKLSKQAVTFALSFVQPNEFAMTVSFLPNAAGVKATIAYKPTNGVTCMWLGKQNSKVVLQSGQSQILSCNRSNRKEKAHVVVLREDGISQSMTIPWQAYDDNGIPIDSLKKIKERVDLLNQENKALKDSLVKIQKKSNNNEKYISSLKSKPNTEASNEIISHDGYWGKWRARAMCPKGQYVCGFRSRIESKQDDGDDTAMNGVRLQCCSF